MQLYPTTSSHITSAETMKTFACTLLFIQLFGVGAELIIRELTENQAFQLSCSPQPGHGGLMGLRLYHRRPHSQTTLLSMWRPSELRVDLGHSGRLLLRGGLHSPQVNVTIPNIQSGDAGLYVFEMSYTDGNSSEHVLLGTQKVLLLVKSTGGSCSCSHSYASLLLVITLATGLLLLPLSWLASVKTRHRYTSQPVPELYEEMNAKRQSFSKHQNNQQPTCHLAEVDLAVYANTNFGQPQENYYACPRHGMTALPAIEHGSAIIAI
ncbi:uncharacterized protein LOC142886851 [Nelusetta ayraudi]|uniref:uncharacterized protein LOC142886851 n=1 Tax=Nelusetta ayraudi TaxID=303726 RepID=UPI003F713F7C